jgi:hypothetical protein
VDVRQSTAWLGGVAERATLVRLTSRAAVHRALRHGDLVRVGHGRYALPAADVALRAAHALDGVVSHRSAALLHGWEVKTLPSLPDVLVPRNRKVTAARRGPVHLHGGTCSADERRTRVTSPVRTLVDCPRMLPFDEALAIADSALRHGALSRDELVRVTSGCRGPGAARAGRVAAAADGRAANPFESVLRAIALQVPGLDVRPQVEITAPSSSRCAPTWSTSVATSCWKRTPSPGTATGWRCGPTQRYNSLVVRGWLVLRFAWEGVMHDPAYVRRILGAVVELTDPAAAHQRRAS